MNGTAFLRKRSGFTIVELLIVILVIAILAGIVIVSYNGITGRARTAAIQSELSSLAGKVQLSQLKNTEYPDALAVADVPSTMRNYMDYRKTPYGYCLAYAEYASAEQYRIKSGGAVEPGYCSGTVSTFAVMPDALGNSIAIGPDDALYVSSNGGTLRKVSRTGTFSTVATGVPGSVRAVASNGDIFSYTSSAIYRTTQSGVVSLIAGHSTGTGYADATSGSMARFNDIRDMVLAPDGALYVADNLNNRIRRVTQAGVVTTFAGSGVNGVADGTGTAAQFRGVTALALVDDTTLFVRHGLVSASSRFVRSVALDTAAVTSTDFSIYADFFAVDGGSVYFTNDTRSIHSFTLLRQPNGTYYTSQGAVGIQTGSNSVGYVDGEGENARFSQITNFVIDSKSAIFALDRGNSRIRKIE